MGHPVVVVLLLTLALWHVYSGPGLVPEAARLQRVAPGPVRPDERSVGAAGVLDLGVVPPHPVPLVGSHVGLRREVPVARDVRVRPDSWNVGPDEKFELSKSKEWLINFLIQENC